MVMNKPEICILIPVWKRPEILTYCIKGLANLYKVYDNLLVTFVLSRDDCKYTQNYVKIHSEIGYSFPFNSVVLDNNYPISQKMNQAINELKLLSWDYLMNLGSDNVLNPDIFSIYQHYFNKKVPYFGLKSAYFINYYTKKVKKSTLDLDKLIFGAGRMISRDIIEQCNYSIYPIEQNQGLDTASAIIIEQTTGKTPESVISTKPMILDIKSDTNINLWEILNSYPNCIDTEIDIKKYFKVKI